MRRLIRRGAIVLLVAAVAALTLSFSGIANAASSGKLDANSVTADRTASEVEQLYDDMISSYSTSGMFAVEPVLTTSGYNPGKLSQDAKDKTLYQLNQYRELAGLNSDVQIFEDNMEWSQYGATAQQIVGSLTHAFTSAQEQTLLKYMSSSEYELAAKGVGAGSGSFSVGTMLWNGNCSTTNNVVMAVKGYIDDTNNVSAGVGHRLNMLDINAQYAWFGASADLYSCMSVAGNPFASNPNTED